MGGPQTLLMKDKFWIVYNKAGKYPVQNPDQLKSNQKGGIAR